MWMDCHEIIGGLDERGSNAEFMPETEVVNLQEGENEKDLIRMMGWIKMKWQYARGSFFLGTNYFLSFSDMALSFFSVGSN